MGREVIDLDAEKAALTAQIARAQSVVDLAVGAQDADRAEAAMRLLVELMAQHTRLCMAQSNAGIVISGARGEGRIRKTSAARTARLVDLSIRLVFQGDERGMMSEYAEYWGINPAAADSDRAELCRHTSGTENRQQAAVFCKAILSHSAQTLLHLTDSEDENVKVKAALGLVAVAKETARLHGLNAPTQIEISARPHIDRSLEELQAIVAGDGAVVIDVPS